MPRLEIASQNDGQYARGSADLHEQLKREGGSVGRRRIEHLISAAGVVCALTWIIALRDGDAGGIDDRLTYNASLTNPWSGP